MNGRERLTELYDADQVKRLNRSGELFRIDHPREGYDDETVLVRFIHRDDDLNEIKKEDNRALERLFYDEDTPNQWNIQLFWAYHDGVKIDDETRSDFESNTRFAIRRCVSVDSLGAFLRPLQTVEEDLNAIDLGFNRGNLIQEINEADLGFLFDLDSTNREERLKKLKQGGSSSPEQVKDDHVEPYRGIIDSIELDPEFRPPAKQRSLDAKPFTLLHGRNGSGKTSLLDAATLGMVGQIRGKNTQRSHHYEDLKVTLTGDEDASITLSNEPSAVANRISAWYGFRPEGNHDRHTEFYHVNYHEAGSTTRLADPDADIDLEQTIRRSLYGEQLSKARSEKRELVTEARKRVEKEEKEITKLEIELSDLEEKAERAESLFSTAQTARAELSPAMRELIPNPPSQQRLQNSETDAEHDEWVRNWSRWSDRLQTLYDSLHIADISDERATTPAELAAALDDEVERTETAVHQLGDIEELQREQTIVRQLYDNLESAGWAESQPSEAIVATILSVHGFEGDDLRSIAEAIDEVDPKPEGTLEEWRTRLKKALEDRHTRLTDKREAIREITDLQARRAELLEKIRSRTEEYLDITDELKYCPACYTEQTKTAIQNRKQPSDLLDSDSGVPGQLKAQIKSLEDAIEILTRPAWSAVADELETRFSDICSAEDYWQVWQRTLADEETVLPRGTENHVTIFAEVIRRDYSGVNTGEMAAETLAGSHDAVDDELISLASSVEDYSLATDDVAQAIRRLEERRDQLIAGVQILTEHIPRVLQQSELRVARDRQVLRSTESELQEDVVVVESVAEIQSNIEETRMDLKMHETEKQGYEDGIERLSTAFERAGGDEEFTAYVREHMSAITTLFQAFQRPYEFKRVLLDDDDKVRVIRRHEEDAEPESEPISDMSSGQRAALALAIFVTNNLTHARAPPVMLLDEPFAHLDDINTISFFNLLIELATRRGDEHDRQVIFATANKDIADLLERKIGDSSKFRRVSVGEGQPNLDNP